MIPEDNPPALIVGLGNPDNKFLNTRHNIGFWFIDSLVDSLRIHFNDNLKKGFCDTHYQSEGIDIKLLKPMTFINDSGTPLKNFIKNKNITPSQIIVAYDDLDLAAGKIRLKFSGGSGGHNGIKDIIEKIGTKDFWRLKIGIGKPTYKDDVISYVLGKPSPDDKKQILEGIENIIHNSQDLLDGSYTNFMNNLNGDNNGI
jgi:PTH1 family peptidyl-tRNA hydrolase